MKFSSSMLRVAAAAVVLVGGASAEAVYASPVGKALQLLTDLQTKIIKEGEDSQKVYREYTEWCEDRSRTLSQEIKVGKSDVSGLGAVIVKETGVIGEMQSKIERLSTEISKDESDLNAANEIRSMEAKTFAAEEKELVETIDVLKRAMSMLERELKKGGASMAQLKGVSNLADALHVLVDASALSTADANKVTALLQSADEDMGAPAGPVYESHSEGILETLSDLLDKAQEQLDGARKKETADTHAFEMMEQALQHEVKNGEKDQSDSKSNSAAAGERKATAEGDLAMTKKELNTDVASLSELHHECMTRSEDFEAETKSRGEELDALAQAKKALTDNTGAADDISYGATSFLQLHQPLAQFDASRFVRALARKHGSTELSQLAARISNAVGSSGDDPFGKVKGLIQSMIEKLEKEADADATHKAFCDKELAETREKKSIKTNSIEKLTTQIDKMSSRSNQLKEDVALLQKGLAELTKAQAEMDKIRVEEKGLYSKNKVDMEQGLKGVKLALKILGEYYAKDDKAHSSADGAGTSVIGLLEVVESDFTKGLAEMTASEDSAQSAFNTETKENEIEKTTKQQDVKYKNKESTELDQAVAEAKSDRDGTQAELSAVQEYLKRIEGQCIIKAETFEERRARFKAEVDGLKEALRVLESETALVQRSRSTRVLRGSSQSRLALDA